MSYTIKRISTSVDNRQEINRRKNLQVKYGIILIFLAIISSTLFTFLSVSQNQAYDKFVSSLRTNNYNNAIVHLEAFKRVFKNKYSSFNSKDSANLPTAEERNEFIVDLIKVMGQLSNNERTEQKKALLTLKRMLYNIHKVTSGVNGRQARYKHYFRQAYEDLVKDFKELRRKEIIGPFKRKENQNRIYQQSILAQDLANEFGALMGLSPLTLRSPTDRTQFYKTGVLKGLPVLNRLPDGIKDLKQLKSDLAKAQGEVSLRGREETPEIFQKRLEELRKKCDVFSGQIDKLQVETDEYSQDVDKLEEIFLKTAAKFVIETKNFVVDYVHLNS